MISRDALFEESAPLLTHEELNKVRTTVSLQHTLVLALWNDGFSIVPNYSRFCNKEKVL